MINFSTRSDKVKKLIQLIADNKEAWDVVITIYFEDIFPFTYNVRRLTDVTSDYPNPGQDVDNLKSGATVAIEFQILSQNFKASKKLTQ